MKRGMFSCLEVRVSAGVQRREQHSCTDHGASRSARQFGYGFEFTTRAAALPRFPIDGSSIGQCEYKKAQWRKRDLIGEVNECESTIIESSVLFLVVSGSSFEMNGTLVTLTSFGDCDLSIQPRSLLQSPRVSPQIGESRSRKHRL